MAPAPLATDTPTSTSRLAGGRKPGYRVEGGPTSEGPRKSQPAPRTCSCSRANTAGGGGGARPFLGRACSGVLPAPRQEDQGVCSCRGPSPPWLGSQAFTFLYLEPSGDSERLLNSEMG